jgi:hypothetical protein
MGINSGFEVFWLVLTKNSPSSTAKKNKMKVVSNYLKNHF